MVVCLYVEVRQPSSELPGISAPWLGGGGGCRPPWKHTALLHRYLRKTTKIKTKTNTMTKTNTNTKTTARWYKWHPCRIRWKRGGRCPLLSPNICRLVLQHKPGENKSNPIWIHWEVEMSIAQLDDDKERLPKWPQLLFEVVSLDWYAQKKR